MSIYLSKREVQIGIGIGVKKGGNGDAVSEVVGIVTIPCIHLYTTHRYTDTPRTLLQGAYVKLYADRLKVVGILIRDAMYYSILSSAWRYVSVVRF